MSTLCFYIVSTLCFYIPPQAVNCTISSHVTGSVSTIWRFRRAIWGNVTEAKRHSGSASKASKPSKKSSLNYSHSPEECTLTGGKLASVASLSCDWHCFNIPASLTYSVTHSLTYSLTYSFTYSLNQPLSHWFSRFLSLSTFLAQVRIGGGDPSAPTTQQKHGFIRSGKEKVEQVLQGLSQTVWQWQGFKRFKRFF